MPLHGFTTVRCSGIFDPCVSRGKLILSPRYGVVRAPTAPHHNFGERLRAVPSKTKMTLFHTALRSEGTASRKCSDTAIINDLTVLSFTEYHFRRGSLKELATKQAHLEYVDKIQHIQCESRRVVYISLPSLVRREPGVLRLSFCRDARPMVK